ncbi:MAG: hypothetical protein LC750_00350 [Actinobacteria bacterium]|nr:hypothetical protein [Actinomycetota bacterium]
MTQALPSKATGKRRLLKLADLLIADARKKKGIKFDLATWVKPSAGGAYDHFTSRPKTAPERNCGTAACAVGLACISPEFNKQGLGLAFRKSFFALDAQYMAVPAFGRRRDFSAVEAFFALTRRESGWLFTAGRYRKSKGANAERTVAKRIRDFVSGRAGPPR